MRTVIVALMLWAATCGTALAQEPASAEAAALFGRGVALGEEDRWAEAHEQFRRSLALVERPATRFNLAYAAFRMGHFVDAIADFDRYGDVGPRAADAVRLRAEAATFVAEVEISVEPADARLVVDGRAIEGSGARRTIALDPGAHHVLALAEGHAEAELDLVLAAGERSSRSITLAREEALVVAPPLAPPSPTPTDVTTEPLFWVALVGGVLVVGGAVTAGVIVGTSGTAAPDGGNTGVVLEALRF